MVDVTVFVDGNEVIASGSLIVPPQSDSITIKLGKLTFNFLFVKDGGESLTYLQGGGKELNVTFKNYKGGDAAGRSKTFMKVGTYDAKTLCLGYRARFNKNGSRDFSYTFMLIPKEDADVNSEAGDE